MSDSRSAAVLDEARAAEAGLLRAIAAADDRIEERSDRPSSLRRRRRRRRVVVVVVVVVVADRVAKRLRENLFRELAMLRSVKKIKDDKVAKARGHRETRTRWRRWRRMRATTTRTKSTPRLPPPPPFRWKARGAERKAWEAREEFTNCAEQLKASLREAVMANAEVSAAEEVLKEIKDGKRYFGEVTAQRFREDLVADREERRVAARAAAEPEGAKPDKPEDDKPDEGLKPEDAKPEDAKSDDDKPEDAKPEDAEPGDAKPGDAEPDAEPDVVLPTTFATKTKEQILAGLDHEKVLVEVDSNSDAGELPPQDVVVVAVIPVVVVAVAVVVVVVLRTPRPRSAPRTSSPPRGPRTSWSPRASRTPTRTREAREAAPDARRRVRRRRAPSPSCGRPDGPTPPRLAASPRRPRTVLASPSSRRR